MDWLIMICGAMVGFILGVICALVAGRERYTAWMSISLNVTEKSTGTQFHADRYRYCLDDGTPCLRVYRNGKYTWFPIWHFKNPYLVMLVIDPEYAKANMLKLFNAEMAHK